MVTAQQSKNRPIRYYSEPETNNLARNLLTERLKDFSSSICAAAFRSQKVKATSEEIKSESQRTRFLDGRKGSMFGNLTQQQIIGNGFDITASETLGVGTLYPSQAVTIHAGRLPSGRSAVLLGDFFGVVTRKGYPADPQDQQNILLHEMVHVMTWWEDQRIFDEFAVHGLPPMKFGSGDFTVWLQAGCPRSSN